MVTGRLGRTSFRLACNKKNGSNAICYMGLYEKSDSRKGETMKNVIMGLLVGLCGLYFFCSPANAQPIYVTGVTKITMRTGPGVDNKIVAMLTSGTKLKMLERGDGWSRVLTEKGKEGWVLTRFLTQDPPLSQVVARLEKKNRNLTRELEQLQTEHREMTRENIRLAGVEKAYEKLSADSENFLKLSEDYKTLVQESQEQQNTIASLEKQLGNDTRFWFLSGAGVFLVGVLLGLGSRPGRRNSLGM